MSNIDKQAIRDAAKEVIAEGGTAWFDEGQLSDKTGLDIPFTDAAFIASASPETVLALLDELEAKDKRIAELEASHSNLREAMAGIHNTITGGGAYTPLAAIMNASKRAYEESAAAAAKGEAS